MKRVLFVLTVVATMLLAAVPALAAGEHPCDHSGDTIGSLRHCVVHAYDMGHITKAGVRDSLLAKLDAAQAAFDRGQTGVAVNQLRAFINETSAQDGKAILAEHAGYLTGHAEIVIAALGGFVTTPTPCSLD